jgi:6-phosphofructokinase
LRVGCVLSGGQAAGGHNVIVGIYDYIKRIHKNSQLFGFLNGPKGIFTGDYVEINDTHINYFKNRGGFDMICSGRDKI